MIPGQLLQLDEPADVDTFFRGDTAPRALF
jgi:hypothetical protein